MPDHPTAYPGVDADTAQLMRDLEQGLAEAQAGVYARITTPEQIAARRGRPPKLRTNSLSRCGSTRMRSPLGGPAAKAGKPVPHKCWPTGPRHIPRLNN